MKLVIFGCGIIANRIAKSVKLVDEIELVGFGSKSIDKAKEYAEKYECKEYGDYDYFLNSDVDAVYIATYNPSHYELIKKCLLAHKNVICEKPMLSSIELNNELFALAKENNVLLMEAMKAVFLPLIIKIKHMINDGELGEIKDIRASFIRGESFKPDHWIFDPKTGGALRDVGSYCAATMNYLLDKNPTVISKVTNGTDARADTIANVEIDYEGIAGHLSASNFLTGDNSLIVQGTKGMIKVENFWKAKEGYCLVDGIEYKLEEELISDFYYELKHFAELVDKGIIESPIMSKDASNKILTITQ
ncbi:MAG: Gfo/Idh/MocA family oxidoreductase [Erysipelotrichaceae bacterium]|nr:Gfo/Idh/MocA family oxidoreductase [Erysipelotrichaceae bacterium]